MNISVVIPNYNGEKILETNLSSILEILSKYEQGKKELIVIDDSSHDASIEKIKQLFEQFPDKTVKTVLLENQKNLGFAPTVNKGVKKATGDILVLLNTDVVPNNDFLESLLPHFSDTSVFAVGCLEKSIEDNKTNLYGRGLGEWRDGFLVHRAGDVKGKTTLWVSCGSGAFRKSIWDQLDGLNEVYTPFYWEDIDLSYRALKCGYTILFEQKSIVTHKHEEGAIKKTQKSSYIHSIVVRNQFLFVWNNLTDSMIFFNHLVSLPLHLARAVADKDFSFVKGFFQAVLRLQDVFTFRSQMTKRFTKTDNQVIAEVNR
jgi:GT2 family glycosyltransferase